MNICEDYLSNLSFIDNCWALAELGLINGEGSKQWSSMESAAFLPFFPATCILFYNNFQLFYKVPRLLE